LQADSHLTANDKTAATLFDLPMDLAKAAYATSSPAKGVGAAVRRKRSAVTSGTGALSGAPRCATPFVIIDDAELRIGARRLNNGASTRLDPRAKRLIRPADHLRIKAPFRDRIFHGRVSIGEDTAASPASLCYNPMTFGILADDELQSGVGVARFRACRSIERSTHCPTKVTAIWDVDRSVNVMVQANKEAMRKTLVAIRNVQNPIVRPLNACALRIERRGVRLA